MNLLKIEPGHKALVRKPDCISISPSGLISFSGTLSKRLSLVSGTGVTFSQDQDKKKDWYISIDPRSVNKVRKKRGTKIYLFNSVALADLILKSRLKTCSITISFLIAKDYVEVEGFKGKFLLVGDCK